MAIVDTQDYSIRRGKMNKKSDVVYRVRNGKQQSYIPAKNSVPPSKAQKAHRVHFGKVTALVNAIMADPQQQAEWTAKRLEYNHSVALDSYAKRYTTTRSFAFAVISAELATKEASRRRKNPVPHALPEGYKMRIKHFSELKTTELYEILKARFNVFYGEQNCRYPDLDNVDYKSIHLALFHGVRVVAYARLFRGKEAGQWVVGRMLTIERGQGWGRYLMDRIIEEAKRQGATSLLLHAQTQAAPFYEKLGFAAFGDVFQEAEIPHVFMKKAIV